MSNNYDSVDLAVDAYEVSDGVSSVTDKLSGGVENINFVSELYKWSSVYKSENATIEQQQYAAIQLMNTFFAIGKDNLPEGITNTLFANGNNPFENSEESLKIATKHIFQTALYDEYRVVSAIDPNCEQAQMLEELLKNIDAAYEAYCIAIKEGAEQDFPKISSEWDLFYASYTENNDPLNNTVEAVDDVGDELVKRITKTFPDIGPIAVDIYEWGEEKIKNWIKFWDGMGETLQETVEDNNDRFMKVLLKRIYGISETVTQASAATYDPLILDLDGDGFNVELKENGTNFDLDTNSFAEKINWTSKDGFLCLDLNGNGEVDNGGEVFGDNTLLADGTTARNGFEALAQYDSNGDGVIDANDEIFSQLKVWVDADGNGESGEGELKSLAELGIESISLNYDLINGETGTEAVIGNGAVFTYTDGTSGNIGELWVSADLFDTIEQVEIEIPDDIKALANVRSIGNVNSLHTAMALANILHFQHKIKR